MRTTLTLDDDVAAQLDQLRARSTRSFKELVNEALRAGLRHLENAEQARARGPYPRAVSLGKARLPDVDDVSEALAILGEPARFRAPGQQSAVVHRTRVGR